MQALIEDKGVIKSIYRTDTFCTDADMIDYDSNEEMPGFQLNQI